MDSKIRPGAVVFCADHARLARFYQALTGMRVSHAGEGHTVLTSVAFELVLHALPEEPAVTTPPTAREDSYLKLFLPVASLAAARETTASLGGQLRPPSSEWEARGFRACDGIDPEGNVFQVREPAADSL